MGIRDGYAQRNCAACSVWYRLRLNLDSEQELRPSGGMGKIVEAKFLTKTWGQFRLRVTVPAFHMTLTLFVTLTNSLEESMKHTLLSILFFFSAMMQVAKAVLKKRLEGSPVGLYHVDDRPIVVFAVVLCSICARLHILP